MGDGGKLEFITIVLIVPLGYVWVMNAMEVFVEDRNIRQRFVKVAWDNCVFALGAVGALAFGATTLPPTRRMTMIALSIMLVFAATVGIALIRRLEHNPGGGNVAATGITGWYALLAVVLSGIALAIPVWLAVYGH